MQELFALALHELGDRDAGPPGDDLGDLLLGDAVAQQGALALLRGALLFLQLLPELGQAAVLDLRGAVQVVLALGLFHLGVELLDLLAELLHLADGALLVLPLGLHLAELRAHVGQLLLDVRQVLLGQGVRLLLQGGLLDLVAHDLAVELIHLRGHGVHLAADHGAGLVHKVDGLVR